MVSSLKNATGALVRGISEDDLAKLPDVNNKDLKTAIVVPGTLDEKALSARGFEKAGGVAIGDGMAQAPSIGYWAARSR